MCVCDTYGGKKRIEKKREERKMVKREEKRGEKKREEITRSQDCGRLFGGQFASCLLLETRPERRHVLNSLYWSFLANDKVGVGF